MVINVNNVLVGQTEEEKRILLKNAGIGNAAMLARMCNEKDDDEVKEVYAEKEDE